MIAYSLCPRARLYRILAVSDCPAGIAVSKTEEDIRYYANGIKRLKHWFALHIKSCPDCWVVEGEA